MRRRFFNNGVEPNYLCIEALEDGLTFSLSENSLEYSIDDYSNWVILNADEVSQSINAGQRAYIKGDILNASLAFGIGTFTITKKCNLSGTPSSLLRNKDLIPSCFFRLFRNCTNIVSVSDNFLPATTLANNCYESMFVGCTSLQAAPELPATTLANNCYTYMFQGCSKLNYIKMLATDISATRCLYNWVSGVASSGTFVKNKDATWTTTGPSGVPSGWTVITDDQEGGGSDSPKPPVEFPLYFDFDYCETSWTSYCARYPDEISKKLADYLQEIAPLIGYDDGYSFILNEDLLEQLGIEIYFKQLRVVQIYVSREGGEPLLFDLNGVYEFGERGDQADWVYLRRDGEIFIEL